MKRRSFLPLVFVAFAAAAFSSDAGAAITRSALTATQIGIGTAPLETVKSLSAIGFEMNLISDSTGRLVPGKKTFGRLAMTRSLAAGRTTLFDTDLAPAVMKIAFEPTIFEVQELQGSGGLTALRPGATKVGNATFTMRQSRPVSDWMRGFLTGASAPRDVTINVKSTSGALVRTMVLKRCLPTAYSSDFQSVQLTLRPESMQISGAGGSRPLNEWIVATFAGASQRRDVKIAYTDPISGAQLGSVAIKNALLTEVAWPTLDGASVDALYDTVTFAPELVEPLP